MYSQNNSAKIKILNFQDDEIREKTKFCEKKH
jgi:hypothetical protein